MLVAIETYRRWGLRCCSAEEFAAWHRQAMQPEARQSRAGLTVLGFCLDGEPRWCAAQREAGQCCLSETQRRRLRRLRAATDAKEALADAEWRAREAMR
jgi:hypothetical protein